MHHVTAHGQRTAQQLLLAAALMAFATACGRLAPPPGATPTVGALVILALPTDTPVPPPSPTPPTPTPDLIATVIAGATELARGTAAPGPTLSPVLVPGEAGRPSTGCELPRQAEQWLLAPLPEAPAEARAAWPETAQRTLTAVVAEHRPEERLFLLQPVDPPADYRLSLAYSGVEPPLSPGRQYRFTYWQDIPGAAPAGVGLKVEDEAGPVFLGVSLRETADADARVLGGDRAGFTVQQLPTRCLYTEVTPCGIELRASPVEVVRGGGKVTLGPGKDVEIPPDPGQPSYRVSVASSHLRRPVAEAPCADPTDWVLSYSIRRAEGGP